MRKVVVFHQFVAESQSNYSAQFQQKKSPQDCVSVTVAIQPLSGHSPRQAYVDDVTLEERKSPGKENADAYMIVKIGAKTTAEDVVRQVLLRSVGSLAGKLVPFYGLGVWVDGRQVFLKGSDVVKNFHGTSCDAQFFLIRQLDDN